jgi:hypothetical protein
MYKIDYYTRLKLTDSIKTVSLIGNGLLLAFIVIVGYLLSTFIPLDGRGVGGILFPLFIISEIPILINYSIFVLLRSNLVPDKLFHFFIKYYAPSLIFHSGVFTIVLGITFLHSLVVSQQSIFCFVLIIVLSILWILEYVFWFIKWPVYPQGEKKINLLYWFQWSIVFGLLIGLPFHAKTWSLFPMISFSTLSFGSLMLIIFHDIRNKERSTRFLREGKLDYEMMDR